MYRKFNKSSNKVDYNGLLIRSRLLTNIANNVNGINPNKVNNPNHNNPNNINPNNPNNVNHNIEIPTFNILIATIGRDSLETLLESLVDQLTERDCITIVFDNNTIRSLKNKDKLKCKIIIYNESSKLGFWGHGIRNKYSRRIEYRDFILHADDDDTYFPNAFDKLRKICKSNDILYIAKVIHRNKRIVPCNNDIKLGNVSTQCGIVPYRYNIEGNWGYFYGGDALYYIEIIRKFRRSKILDIYLYNYENTDENLTFFKNLTNLSSSQHNI